MTRLTPDVLLNAYAAGVFPMADSAEDDALYWIDPEERGILPLSKFHVPKRLGRTIRMDRFEIRIDHDFSQVIAACAQNAPDRESTWINQRITDLYGQLFETKQCHTVEVWADGALVGGLYGLAMGGVFFGESMFSRQRDVSKVALVYLAARLIEGGFGLLDTQFLTDHLTQFGAIEIPRDVYHVRLKEALALEADFYRLSPGLSGAEVLQSVSQMS